VIATETEEERLTDDRSHGECESPFAWEWRVMAVSAFWLLPGILAGALSRLCVPDGGPPFWWLIGGGIVTATLGGLLEADHLIEL
jgi:hypothetical protein